MYLSVIRTILFANVIANSVMGNVKNCSLSAVLSKANINELQSCEHLLGVLYISNDTMKDATSEDFSSLRSIKSITGRLLIKANHPHFIDLSFLESLETIGNNLGKTNEICVTIDGTSLKSINLPALKEIGCSVRIQNNKDLCYSNQWRHPKTMNEGHRKRSIIRLNKNVKYCPCSPQCNKRGCWGSGLDQCHAEPELGCDGSTDGRCNYLTTGAVTEGITCPLSAFLSMEECVECHEACLRGCPAPNSNYGPLGCNFCSKAILPDGAVHCVRLKDSCPSDYIATFDIERVDHRALVDLTAFNGTMMCYQEKASSDYIIIAIVITALTIKIFLCCGAAVLYRHEITNIFRRKRVIITCPKEPWAMEHAPLLLSKLLIIKTSEIEKVKALGQGAFGAVYEGLWKPDGSSNKVPVAIKELQDKFTISSNKEFLREAAMMAEMDHENIVHVHGVCVAAEIQIVTKLMPLGCLLSYVRKNKEDISPKSLLAWSTQIAKGMAYLEAKHLVHRDLAARNVLLETVDCIKIADFGLSKFVGTKDMINGTTKLPLKWLAIESLEEQVFTHKSDVWSFGVTVWELLTFGQTPFVNIQSRALSKKLKLGLRLPQPACCNADVYVMLISCWLIKPELRPDFKELETTLKTMSYDPWRYLADYGQCQFIQINQPTPPCTENASKDKVRPSMVIPIHSSKYSMSCEEDGYLEPTHNQIFFTNPVYNDIV